jgi:hypothetical protein
MSAGAQHAALQASTVAAADTRVEDQYNAKKSCALLARVATFLRLSGSQIIMEPLLVAHHTFASAQIMFDSSCGLNELRRRSVAAKNSTSMLPEGLTLKRANAHNMLATPCNHVIDNTKGLSVEYAAGTAGCSNSNTYTV